MTRYRRLRHEDRCQIDALLQRGVSQAQVAAQLGFSQSSVSREIARNCTRGTYRHEQAQAKAQARQSVRAQPRKLTSRLRAMIMRLLQTKRWSPEQISDHLARRAASISHETIYRMIWRDKHAGGELWRCLRRRGKRYNKRADKTAGRGIIPGRIDISCRPKIVDQRRRIGDWEGDTMMGCKRRGALLTLVERRTRMLKMKLLPQATTALTSRAIIRRMKRIAKRVHTITFDNGKEFAGHAEIALALNARIYFARPYHAWERGLNENTNGLIRDFFPKGTDFTKLSHAQVARVERLLNDRPRKILGFKSPSEAFRATARR
jgi:transposase, IS30 family